MPPPQNSHALPLEIELVQSADQREIETYVHQYATDLCADLGLPVTVSVSLKAVDQETFNQPGLFRIVVAGQPCRWPWWPQPILPDRPSAQDVAELICLALYRCREFLLTSDLARLIASDWGIADGNGYRPDWSPEAFLSFLRAFPKYNFSLSHAHRFITALSAGVSSESDAAYLFEQAMEETTDLVFGPAVTVCPEEYSEEHKPEYDESFKSLTKDLNGNMGLVYPEIRIKFGQLMPGEFQIQLNDVHLPVIRGLARREILLLDNRSELTAREITTSQLFDPIGCYWLPCAEDSPEIRTTRVKVWSGGPVSYLQNSLSLIILGDAGCLLVSPVVHLLLENLKKTAANAVSSVRTQFGESPPFHRRLTVILRRLLDEQVPIVDLFGILEGLLSLREVKKNGERLGVYQFSELEDSPLLVGHNKSLAELSAGDFVFAARLGVRSLSVKIQEAGRQVLPVLPLTPELEMALSLRCGDEVLSQEQGKKIVDLLDAQPSRDLAVVVRQNLRAEIRERLRCEFPAVPVFGSSEIPKAVLAEGYHTLGRTLYAAKRFVGALEAISKAKCLQPEEVIYHSELGQIYDALDRPADAKAEYELAAQVASDPRWRAEIANTFFNRRAYAEAIRLYRGLVEGEPGNAAYFNRLGDCLCAAGAFRRAIDAYRQAISLAPKEGVCHANLGRALRLQGDYVTDKAQKLRYYAEAAEECQHAIGIEPGTGWYHHYRSIPLQRLLLWDEAATELREAIRLDQKDVAARLELANCLSQQGHLDEAAQELEASSAAYPSVLEIQMALAKAYAQAGEYAKAVTQAETISEMESAPKELVESLTVLRNAQETAAKLSTEPQNAELYAALGNIHVKLDNLQAAAAQYRSAAALDRSKADYHKWLGNTLFKQEDWQGAALEWEIVLRLEPNNALNVNNLGTAYDGLEQVEKAKDCYQKAISLAPGNFVPQYNLGGSNFRLQSIKEASDAYLESVKSNDKFAPAHFHLGNCFYNLGPREGAITEWEKAIQLDSKYVEPLYNLGVALWQTDNAPGERRTKAKHCWKEALRLDPNLTVAEDNIDAIEPRDKASQPREPDHLEIFDLVRTR